MTLIRALRFAVFLSVAWLAFTTRLFAADSAVVVANCGTPPVTYTAGQSFAMTQNTTGTLCTSATVTVSGTSSVNIAQVNGHTVVESASGVMKVGITGNAGAALDAAVGAAPPANAVQVGGVASGATGGLTASLKTCDLHAKYDSNDNGNITLVTGVASRKVYICGYILANGGTATNLSLTEGSDANCATSNAGLTPVYQILANQSVGVMSPFWAGLAVSTNAYFVCVKSSAGNAHQAEIFYTIQ